MVRLVAGATTPTVRFGYAKCTQGYSLRLSLRIRAHAFRAGDFLRFISLYPAAITRTGFNEQRTKGY